MEKQSHDRVSTFLETIYRLLTTYWAFLSHPRRSFSNFYSSLRSQLTIPGYFLLANIIFSLLLGHSIGYELPPFPFDLPFLQILGSSYLFVFVVRFLFGILAFFLIFRWLIRYKKAESFLQTVYPILCFSSVVYLPVLLIKKYYWHKIIQELFELLPNFLNGVWPKFLAWTLVKYLLLTPLIFLALIAWWFWLIRTGLTFSKLKSPNLLRKLVLAYILFLGLQFLSVLVATTYINWSFIYGCKTLIFQDIQAALSKRPPDFFKAAILSANIADNKDMPPYVRYMFKIKKASYFLATPILFEGDTAFTRQVLRELDLKEFTSVKSLLTAHLHELSSDRKNPKRQSFLQLENELKEAEDLYNSPGFVDFGEAGKLEFGFIYGLGKSNRYSVDANDKIIRIYVAVQPSWITLFP